MTAAPTRERAAGARISPGRRADTGLAAAAFARAAGRVMGTRPPAVFTTLARTRRTFWAWLAYSGSLMPFGALPRTDTELVILRIAHRRGSAYEWAHHERLGRRVGLTRQQIAAVRDDDEPQPWTPRERALLSAVDELLSSRDLGDDAWAALRERCSERECVELLMLIAQYDGLATVLHTLRISPDEPR